ncbi:MAG: NAD-glutamate dehydrogenase [Rhodospirillaceae bacterium BRH_c57]|nr:MAG: NAD-glutamate dehydrogenase [Rhodospirillaceae bacterium BRH_c57]
MTAKAETLKEDQVAKVIALIRERHGQERESGRLGTRGAGTGGDGTRAEALELFARQYYTNVPPSDIAGVDAERLYGAVTSLWHFTRDRAPGTPKLRVFNPRVEEHGWHGDHTVIETVNDDMPFLVDSVTAALAALELPPLVVIHPVIYMRRDTDGTLVDLLPPDAPLATGDVVESVIHIEIHEQADPMVLRQIADELASVLAEVRAAVEDWHTMQSRVNEVITDLDNSPPGMTIEDAAEVRDFLTWLLDNHFTFLGHRDHTFLPDEVDPSRVVVGVADGLGILRDRNRLVFDELRHLSDLPAEVRAFLNQPTFLLITKANRRSRVHRPVHLDVIGIKRFGADGQVVGMHLLAGLFTSNVYTSSPAFVPVLRRKIERVMRHAGFRPFSHDGKRLLNILESLPRDELFQASDAKLLDMALGILHLQERQRTALFLRQDEFERFISCLVFVPRDRYDTALRLAVQGILEGAFGGVLSAYYTQVADSPLARLHFIIKTTPGAIPDYDPAAIEGRIAEAARAWADHLHDVILSTKGEEVGARLARRYGEAFPTFYRERFNAQAAVFDIDRMEDALDGTASGRDGLGMNLYRPLEAAEEEVNFKVYHPDSAVPLSEILPMLENMGFRVIGEIPFAIRLDGGRRVVWIHDFSMSPADGSRLPISEVRATFQEAFAKVWDGEVENDAFNKLVILAGLSWRDVVILRAYAKYLRQAAFTFSQGAIEQTLAAHPSITRGLIHLFHARFDPARQGAAAEDQDTLAAGIERALEKVVSPDEDRILRRFLNLVRSTVRTNFYQTTEGGGHKPYLSFKIDSGVLDDLPLPRPWREVWVYSPRVEAIHLRGGKVARGGIRWSDRREDFRTEVLGLMKAQMVKNAVIVPVGSKGGFVVKRPPPPDAGREAIQAEGIACYQTMMRGLLDLTDNIGPEGIIPPPDVVRRDDDDPYLVVAADKGTATFSDIANGISIDYGFWLGDAFASGGSQGYDHKAMGITARGAWEAVKRHFREVGRDIQTQDFTVVGVGDMSGDVFGNGMLLSHHIKLLAAFNHMHIFIDPNPDPEASWAERKRLFDTPRSTWADYNPALISDGGAVFERRAKRLTVTPQIKALLGLDRDVLTPAELMRAVLRADADLLWFGGIGTYVKASAESHADAGDRANDAIRISAPELRAKVVGEGANLGVTQRARIEFALTGGRINTDAIDNSAGVDTSDHEVNIKILLNRVMSDGDLTPKQRNALLVAMTDEVAALVLRDNYLQTQAISLMEARGVSMMDHQHRLMKMLERSGRLDRAIEFLPDDEQIAERLAAKRGLTRPELAVVIAYSKIWLLDEILDSDLPDDPVTFDDLVGYFPTALRQDWRDQIAAHRLRREIIATHATNSMVNRVGGTFVTQIMEKTGMPASEIARAYLIGRDSFALRELWRDVETLDNVVSADVQIAMLGEANRLIERTTLWILRHAPRPLNMGGLTAAFTEGMRAMEGCMAGVCTLDVQSEIAARHDRYAEAGVPEDLAARVAHLIVLASTPDVVRLGADLEVDLVTAASHYFAVGSRFGLGWLRAAAERHPGGSHWEKLAVAAVIDELYADQRALTARVLSFVDVVGVGAHADPNDAIQAWTETCRAAVDRADQLVIELRAASTIDLAMLTVASRQFGTLKGG